jgi:hypothetical protein
MISETRDTKASREISRPSDRLKGFFYGWFGSDKIVALDGAGEKIIFTG